METHLTYHGDAFWFDIRDVGKSYTDIEAINGTLLIGTWVRHPAIFMTLDASGERNSHIIADAAFSVHLMPPSQRTFPLKTITPFIIRVIDTTRTEIVATRTIAILGGTVTVLNNAIKQQSESRWEPRVYDSVINEVYGKHDTISLIRCAPTKLVVPGKNGVGIGRCY